MIKKFITILISAAALSLTANAAFAAIPIDNDAEYDGDETVTFIVEVEGDALLASDAAAQLGTDYIDTSEAQKRESELLKTQKRVLSEIQKKTGIKTGAGYTYTAVLNGFSIDAPKSKMDEIKAVDGVKSVTIAQAMETNLATAVDMTSSLPTQTADSTADTGYTGEGQVIAILDNEFDTGHEFFSVEPENPALSKSDVANIIKSSAMNVDVAANQVYKSAKIPFAYDYVNGTSDTYSSDVETYHGTHVAGIAAGSGAAVNAKDENGEEKEYTFSGVAPEAQLVLMKVGTADGNIDTAASVAAADDAVKMGVCAINMSFGLTYVSEASDPIYAEVFENARNAGVIITVAECNSGIGYNELTADTLTPDYSTSGSPAVYSAATAVAAANNSYFFNDLAILKAADGKIIYCENTYSDSSFDTIYDGQTIEYVYCGLGYAEDFENTDVNGKIALIDRGEIQFDEKVNNAKAAGASAVILCNTEDGTANFVNTINLSLPTVMIEKSSGEYLKEAEKKTVTVTASALLCLPAEDTETMWYKTSVGIDETLELKPEITAPGANIYSSVPDDEYDSYSGTSMAAPYMAGVAALMNEYLDKNEFLDENGDAVSGAERASLIENMLMSAADIIEQPENTDGEVVPYSPRVQGAGMVNTAAAMKTAAVFIGDSGKSKLSLGEIGGSFTLDFTVKNLTDEEVVYDSVSLDVLTDGYQTDEDGNNYVVLNNAVRMTVAESDIPDSITVPAGGETEVSINVTLDSDEVKEIGKIFKNGFYVDGFVTLAVSGGSDIPTISMPFAGFYGDWTAQHVFDSTMYDADGSTLVNEELGLDGTYLYSCLSEGRAAYAFCLGMDANGEYNKDMIAISPNGDGMGDILGLELTAWRAVKNLTLEFMGESLDILQTTEDVIPKYYGTGIDFYELDDLDESEMPEGEYILKVSGEFNYDGAKTESFTLPVTVDRTAPEITDVHIDGGTLYVSASDNNYLYCTDIIYTDEDGEEDCQSYAADAKKGGACTAEFDISGLDADDITIVVYDTALNSAEIELSNAAGTILASMTDYASLWNLTAAAAELTNSGDSTVSGDAVIAFYDEDGALIALTFQSVSIDPLETVECTFEMFANTQNAAAAKLYIWDSVSGMSPLDTVKTFDLTQ